MGYWKLIVPESGTNLVTNPSFETGTTGWSASGTNTIAQTTDAALFGAHALECTYQNNTTLATFSGITLTAAAHTFSAYVYLPSSWDGGAVRLAIANFTSATTDTATTTTTTTGAWVRLQMTFTPDAGDLTGDITVETASAPTAGELVYVDAVQVEAQSYVTTFIDGDQAGCSWDGAQHGSTSTRVAYGVGGRVRDFNDNLNIPAERMYGVGVPPVVNSFSPLALQNGSLLEHTRYGSRMLAIDGTINGSTQSDMHDKRQTLIKALNPWTGKFNSKPQLRRLRYTGATVEKEIDVVYDAGLELDRQTGFADEPQLRFIAPDPLFYQVGETSAALSTTSSVATRGVIGYIDGAWDALGPPDSGGTYTQPRAVAIDEVNGIVYFAGTFSNFDNIANADNIVAYDIEAGTYSALGTGASSIIYSLALDASGNLYAAGAFTTIGGTAANRVAYWDGSSWNAMGSGLDDGYGYDLLYATDGKLYVCGSFTAVEGGTTANHVAYWDGAAWNAMGTGTVGCNQNVYALAERATDGLIFMGGDFTQCGGTTANRVGSYTPADNALGVPAGSGLNSSVYTMTADDSGAIYIGGDFTAASAGTSIARIAKYQSATLSQLGGGIDDNTVYGTALDDAGNLWIVGSFTSVDGSDIYPAIARWNGSRWEGVEVDIAASIMYGVDTVGEDAYFCGPITTSTTFPGSTSVAYGGTAIAYPVITIKRGGGTLARIRRLSNTTTGAALFSVYELQDGETLTIDTRPGKQSVTSSLYGASWSAITGDFGSWYLVPGNGSGDRTNTVKLSVITSGSPTVTALVRWRTAYLSVD